MNLAYRKLDDWERDLWLRKIVEILLSDPPKAGADRHADWERGWAQHANATTAKDLIPGYFGKYSVVRHNGELVGCARPTTEYEALAELQNELFTQYFKSALRVAEFGCGTWHNLLRAHKINPTARLKGLDWTTAAIDLGFRLQDTLFSGRIAARTFDFFNPTGAIADRSAVLTCAALEQVGTQFRPFIDWLIEQRPSTVLHIEPIDELLDPTNLLDFLSLEYSRKRGYLSGLLTYLRQLEAEDKITIHEARRSGVGSLLLDGYSIVAWSPK